MAQWTRSAPKTVNGFALSLIARAYGAKVAEVTTRDLPSYVWASTATRAVAAEREVREYARTFIDQYDQNTKCADILATLQAALAEAESHI